MIAKTVMCPCGARPKRRRAAFTLIEMMVVIGIIAIVAGISVPALKNMQKTDAVAAATRQMQDSLARARQFAISQRTTVYMVFVPPSFWTDPAYGPLQAGFTPEDHRAVTNLLDKQYVGYNFVSLREVGGQPGQRRPRYLDEWRAMPEGTFVPEFMFRGRMAGEFIPDSGRVDPVNGFSWTNGIPFPRAHTASPSGTYPSLPYIAFNHLGQVVSDRDEEIIPLARGSAYQPLDVNKRPRFDVASLAEKPPGNSTNSAYTLIVVDRLTGRAHVERKSIP